MSKIVVPKLQQTTDYSIFKFLDTNREINPRHLLRLKRSIEQKNLLYLFPVVCNKKMEVIDGQHRIKSAEELKLPVFFLVDESITKADIAMVNNNRQGWSAKDYVHFYAKDGRRPFQRLQKFLDEHPKLTVGTGIKLLDARFTGYFSNAGGSVTVLMRAGNIKDDSFEVAEWVLQTARQISKKRPYAYQYAFLLDMKACIVDSGLVPMTASKKITGAMANLPEDIEKGHSFRWWFKELLGIKRDRFRTSAQVADETSSKRNTPQEDGKKFQLNP